MILTFFQKTRTFYENLINATEQSWATMTGRLPYIAVAILAGYASPEFMHRLKEVAKAVFSKDETSPNQNSSQYQQNG